MSWVTELARADIVALRVYEHAAWRPELQRLHANELPWDPSGRDAREGLNRYPQPQPRALLERLAELYGVSPASVLLGRGSDEAIDLLCRAFCRAGMDAALVCPPTFGMYSVSARIQGAAVIEVPLLAEHGFALDEQQVLERCTARTKLLFLCSPNNPTGNLLEPETMEEIAALARKGLYVVSDEIYHGLVYESKEHSILEFTDHAFVINGFSKLYAMTGWRLGYLIAPPEFVRPIQKMQQNLFISANDFVQWAGIAALEEASEEVEAMVRTYDQRRRFLLPRLREIGLGVAVEPHGAFYILANARRFSDDSYSLAMDILEKARVAVTPGIDFGSNAEGFIRFSYANDLKQLEKGVQRLADYLSRLQG